MPPTTKTLVRSTRRAVLRSCLAISLVAASVPASAENSPKPKGVDPGAPRPMQADSANVEKAKKSMMQAKQIVLACRLYAGDNDGAYPVTLDVLSPNYVDADALKKLLVSPFAPDQPVGYTYHPGLKDDAAPETVVLEDKFAPKAIGVKIVVYLDNSAEVTK